MTFVGAILDIDALCPSVSSSTCPAPAPCQCHDGVINCEMQNLSCVPDILPKPGNFHSLNMRQNSITTIPNAAFSTLNITTLYLDHNNISSIGDFAFKGLETLKCLYLQHNSLKDLPGALKYFLVNLAELDVSFNPIDGERITNGSLVEGFIDDVVKVIGISLASFKFGDQGSLAHWPRTLNHFQQLNELHISGLNKAIRYIPPSQFTSFELTLEKLSIENTQLFAIPHDIGKLYRLKELYIRHNEIFHGNDIIVENVFIGIGDTLETLALENDNITKSPEGFEHLVNLKNLSLAGNPLNYFSDESIYSLSNGKLKILILRNCSLNRPPGAISSLSSLEELDLSDNNIWAVERGDIARLPNLTSVSFSGNPIMYVSRTAFFGLPSLISLDFTNTRLTDIPNVVQNLYSLKTLDFTNARIDCTCDMYWVKRWIIRLGSEVHVKGECETVDYPIQGYIDMRLPQCLQYKETPLVEF